MGLEANIWKESNMYDVIIVGGGIAALTASIYLKRANLKVGFIETNIPGGKVVNESIVENFPSYINVNGADLAVKIFEQTAALGVEYIYGKVVDIRASKSDKYIIATEDNVLRLAKSVIVATGSKERKLEIPGEEEYTNKGVSYCAICDGTLAKGKNVIVIGGGNSALTGAAYLAKLCKEVHLVHRRDEFKADAIIIDNVKSFKNIIFHVNKNSTKVIGNGASVTGLEIEDTITKEKSIIASDYVFVYVGAIASTDFLPEEIKMDENKYIIVNKNMETNLNGFYAAGDCTSNPHRQLTISAGEGTEAALSVIEYLRKNPKL